jgi:sulfatase maturation enzyme AslB (radical SAM superfamily)
MKNTDIKIWYNCNNYCYFCIQWDKRKKYKPKALSEIKNILKNEYDIWVRWVNFTWWEPTVHETLLPGIEYAKKIWYTLIKIQSNWQNFWDLEYCIKLIKAWANSFEPSIHWFNAKTHDYLVKTPWWWEKVVRWIYNLRKLWQYVTINSVITKQNYKEAPQLAKLLVGLKVNYFQYAFPHIWGSARKYAEKIVPQKSKIMPYIHKWLDIGENAWITARTEAIPFCFMIWYENHIWERFLWDFSIHDAAYKTKSYKEYRLNEGKIKRNECRKCREYNRSEWPWKEYPELFWWKEFIIIK